MAADTPLLINLDLNITGMDCADCALTLEKSVARLHGVTTCQVNFSTGTMHVESTTASEDDVAARIRALGYNIATPGAPTATAVPDLTGLHGLVRFLLSRRDTRLALIAGALVLAGAGLSLLNVPWPVIAALHVLGIVLAGTPILVNGWRALLLGREVTINLLMSIATVGALVIGETAEAATVIILFAIGEALEGYSTERARYSLQSLLTLVPQEAIALRPCIDCDEHLGQDGYEGGPCPFCGTHETRLPVGQLQIGDTILIPPGDRIPMDGRVTSGTSAVNQAPITGESAPVDKAVNDEVFAGSINGAGTLEVVVTRLAADNTLSRIIHLVQEAQAQRAPTQRFIDRFAQWYTPAVVVLAAGIALVPPLFFNAPFWNPPDGSAGWLYRSLALLIVACPCALVISTPVTIVSALTRAARDGILIKGGAPLEALAGVRVFAFDKTGTLTAGQPDLQTVHAVDCTASDTICPACDDLLALAAAVERRSEHPVAQAIVTAAKARQLLARYPAAQAVASLTADNGRGVRGEVGGQVITIGNHALFEQAHPHPAALCDEIDALERQGQTAMLLGDGNRVRGVLSVADTPRPHSRRTLAALKRAVPTAHTIMLTGDNAAVAAAVAATVGVDEVRANLLPAQKLAAVQELAAAHGAVAMVGDGINDAPALAAATVGIAMGGAGTQQAMETADVVLMQDDLSRLPDAVQLSRRTRRVIRENVLLSLGIKLAFLLLTLFGWATLWFAVFADVGASLLVTFNGMRLLRQHDRLAAPLPEGALPHHD
ncbi:MAG: heavy metal translocating P-type ATPase [Anaerolineae bacterium]|nr:heavy metal translocating P-type ATPase [Anaerolineae bacterium]